MSEGAAQRAALRTSHTKGTRPVPAQAWITLIVGVFAVVGVAGTVNQRTRADNRSQSWQRITWCLERTVSDNPDEVALGWTVFGTVVATPFIAKTDRRTLRAIADRDIDLGSADLAETDDNSDNGPTADREERA
ncbi:hypothetical protein CH251_12225 [Rhodococcus sp. 06-462-5]|nr:hypothetical protein CH251_12225 [Rhodococcus sp. 06-462-5]OZE67898.1 hypothetical protein CH270_09185 [Rhodococcus sp. 02-925g]OZF51097.1 hypothetical protein CH291_05795 [Rhodococcus sp. 14-1411-2a]